MVRILAIGAHPDDVEFGCSATLALRQERGDEIFILVLSRGEQGGIEGAEGRDQEAFKSGDHIGAKVYVEELPDTKISDGRDTVEILEIYNNLVQPDVVFVNHPHDTHQDHRNTAMAVISAFRDRPDTILFYETPSTRDFTPLSYMRVEERHIEKKLLMIAEHTSQKDKVYASRESVLALAKYRSGQIRSDGYAEAFIPHRMVWR